MFNRTTCVVVSGRPVGSHDSTHFLQELSELQRTLYIRMQMTEINQYVSVFHVLRGRSIVDRKGDFTAKRKHVSKQAPETLQQRVLRLKRTPHKRIAIHCIPTRAGGNEQTIAGIQTALGQPGSTARRLCLRFEPISIYVCKAAFLEGGFSKFGKHGSEQCWELLRGTAGTVAKLPALVQKIFTGRVCNKMTGQLRPWKLGVSSVDPQVTLNRRSRSKRRIAMRS